MTEEIKCSSCKKKSANDSGAVKFKCPNCGKSEIVRCKDCRTIAAKYICPSCHFSGPN